MPHIFVTTREGREHKVDASAGSTAMEALRNGGIDEILAMCGGSCSCATCHVYVDSRFVDALPQVSHDENSLLDASSHRKETSRLSCQIVMSPELDGLRVTVAPED